MNWVLDADIEAYFDMIPHDRLMKTLAERIVDGAMLALVKRILDSAGHRRTQWWRPTA